MAFNNYQGNNGYNQGGNQDGEKKKTNFAVGIIKGNDAKMNVSIWKSDKGSIYTVMRVTAVAGKDPSTGMPVYVQKMSNELPAVYLDNTKVKLLVSVLSDALANNKLGELSGTIDCGKSKLTIAGSGSSIVFTIDNQKTGPGTITIPATQVGSKNYYDQIEVLIDILDKICYNKGLYNRLDENEFANVMPSAPAPGTGSDEFSPF